MADDSRSSCLGEGECAEIGIGSDPSQPRSRFGDRYPRKLQTPPSLTPSPTCPSINSMAPAFTRYFDYLESTIDHWGEQLAPLHGSRNIASPSPNPDELDLPSSSGCGTRGPACLFRSPLTALHVLVRQPLHLPSAPVAGRGLLQSSHGVPCPEWEPGLHYPWKSFSCGRVTASGRSVPCIDMYLYVCRTWLILAHCAGGTGAEYDKRNVYTL